MGASEASIEFEGAIDFGFARLGTAGAAPKAMERFAKQGPGTRMARFQVSHAAAQPDDQWQVSLGPRDVVFPR